MLIFLDTSSFTRKHTAIFATSNWSFILKSSIVHFRLNNVLFSNEQKKKKTPYLLASTAYHEVVNITEGDDI